MRSGNEVRAPARITLVKDMANVEEQDIRRRVFRPVANESIREMIPPISGAENAITRKKQRGITIVKRA